MRNVLGTALLTAVLFVCGCAAEERALPPYGIVPDAEGLTSERIVEAVEDWNAALGEEVFYVAPADTAPEQTGFVYVRVMDIAPRSGRETCKAPCQYFNIDVGPRYVRSLNTVRHELGHVLVEGNEHSADPGDLMYERNNPWVRQPITAPTIARVREVLGL